MILVRRRLGTLGDYDDYDDDTEDLRRLRNILGRLPRPFPSVAPSQTTAELST